MQDVDIELTDPEVRRATVNALHDLFRAARLYERGVLFDPIPDVRLARYFEFAKALVGDDVIEEEIET
jgi:lipoprotein NlpI